MPRLNERIETDIKMKEHAFWAGLSSRSPEEVLLPLLAPDCVLHLPNSPPLSSDTEPALEEAVSDPKSFKKWDKYDLEQMHVTVIDLMAAFVCYHVSASRGGKDYEALCTTVWKQEADGEWKAACHTQTLSPHGYD
ncbi:hypothetical protein HIM_06688 [Hirsutella minnesotensis 3608]|uniref:DUF4440 domain-containing protein n=1 Tax=Hirsutella minnesotensis 3608 TaxID=1043627 RepID=A0A0F7ZNM7_9HYPO|nr:hypothetical protein HIM_06688 [Hirsutella minnesotensis 3608]